MKKFCVAYDLLGDDRKRDYTLINNRLLELLELSEWSEVERIQESVWILTLDDSWTYKLIEEDLIGYFGDEDRLFISRISDKYTLINHY